MTVDYCIKDLHLTMIKPFLTFIIINSCRHIKFPIFYNKKEFVKIHNKIHQNILQFDAFLML